jgi:hypothetical protein
MSQRKLGITSGEVKMANSNYINVGDKFRHKGFAGPLYVATYEYRWHGDRRIVGWYQHAPNQKVGIDLPDNELEKTREG